MKKILAPSLLAADFTVLGDQIKQTQTAGAAYLHFDVMDGHFVPSISFGMPVLASIKKASDQVMDVHLMITDPIRYVEAFAKAGADILTIHLEACSNAHETLDKIQEFGMKKSISIKPGTPVESLNEYLEKVDMILVMTVEPGFGGQKLIPETLEKVRILRKLIQEKNLDIDIQVDGGIYYTNVHEVLEAGANVIVSGSGVFNGNIQDNVNKFLEAFKG